MIRLKEVTLPKDQENKYVGNTITIGSKYV